MARIDTPKPHPAHGLANTPTKPVGVCNDRFTTFAVTGSGGVPTNWSYVVDVVDGGRATTPDVTVVGRCSAVIDVVDVVGNGGVGVSVRMTTRVVPVGSVVGGGGSSTPGPGVSTVGTGAVIVGRSVVGSAVTDVEGTGVSVGSCAYATPPDIIARNRANPAAIRRMILSFQFRLSSGTYGCSSAAVKVET
jgi:hypothetical protein